MTDQHLPFQWTEADVARLIDAERAVPVAVEASGFPVESWAAHQDVRNVRESHRWILDLLGEQGPKTDERIYLMLRGKGHAISQSGARTRRKELVDLGMIVKAGVTRSRSGRAMGIWGLPGQEADAEKAVN